MSQQEEDFTIFIIPLPVLMEDEPIHTSSNPFCGDYNCICYQNQDAYTEEIKMPLYEGILSFEEAVRIYGGLQQAA